jgi:hypothetical protein
MNTNDKKSVSLIINGEFPTSKEIMNQIKSSEIIIAIDGATNTLIDCGIIPTVSIGDFDSIDMSNKKKVSQLIYKEDQNKTDLEKTLDWCIENNYLSLSIFGISGKSLVKKGPINLDNILIAPPASPTFISPSQRVRTPAMLLISMTKNTSTHGLQSQPELLQRDFLLKLFR